jgi:hypothetical protein
MTKFTLTYAWTIIAIGIAILVSGVWQWQSASGTAFGVCLALAVFASTLKLKLTGLEETISPGFVFVLISVAMLSWTETVVIAVASGLVQCLWRAKTPPSPLQIGFAAGTMAMAGGLTHGVTWGLAAGMRGTDDMAVILGVAGVVLLVSNTLIVSTIVCLIKEGPFEMVWRSVQCRAVPYYLAGGLIADVWVRAKLTGPTSIALLAAISVYLLSMCFRELERLAWQPQAVKLRAG